MKKFYIDFEEVNESKFYEELEDEVNHYVEEGYDDILDECYPSYKICDIEFYASEILQKCDPTAYNCGISDEQSYRLEEAKYELENYGEYGVNGIEFKIEEEDEEEEI